MYTIVYKRSRTSKKVREVFCEDVATCKETLDYIRENGGSGYLVNSNDQQGLMLY